MKLLLIEFFSLFPGSFEALSVLSCGCKFNEGFLVLLVDGFEIVFIVVFPLGSRVFFYGSNLEVKVFENHSFNTRFLWGLETLIFYLRLRVLCLVLRLREIGGRKLVLGIRFKDQRGASFIRFRELRRLNNFHVRNGLRSKLFTHVVKVEPEGGNTSLIHHLSFDGDEAPLRGPCFGQILKDS